jgi:hypothetical protein
MRRLCVVLCFVASCSGGSGATPSPPASAPAASAAPAAPIAPAAAPAVAPALAPAVERPPPRERAASQIRLLREARRAARAHDYTTALDRFDQMLRAAPRSPRIACEAGFVAHQAGRDDLAEPRIELALRGFGPDDELAPDMRVPAAMCLYNAGLVYEARGDRAAASSAYERSLRLRPSDAVSRRRAALSGAAASARREAELIVRAETDEQFADALGEIFSTEGWDDEPTTAESEKLAELALPAGGAFTRAVLFTVNDRAPMLEDVSYVVALRRPDGGHLLFGSEVGFYDSQENGSNDSCDVEFGSMVVDHGLLRIDFSITVGNDTENEYEWEEHPDYTCYEMTTEPDEISDATILCSLSQPACVRIDHGARTRGHAGRDIVCSDEEGEDVPGPTLAPEPEEEGAAHYEARLEIADGPVVRVTPISGALPTPALAGEHGWSELLGIAEALFRPSRAEREDDHADE